jgi:hypothetical protein
VGVVGVVVGVVMRDQRYKYQQPGFTSGTDKTFDMPGPAAYNVREVVRLS